LARVLILGGLTAMRITALTSPYAKIRAEHMLTTWNFHVAAWRGEDGILMRGFLRVDLPANPLDWLRRRARVTPANLIAADVSWPPRPAAESWNSPSVTLLRWHSAPVDADLAELQHQMLNPPATLTFPFGTLTRDPRTDFYTGEAAWGAGTIKVTLNGEFGSETDRQAIVMAAMLADQPRWETAMRAVLSDEYQNWCSNWRGESERSLSRDAFVSAFRLKEIELVDPSMLTFWLDDAGLFGHHAIELRGTPDGFGPQSFGLMG
jgi:hypothetical protein